MAEQLKFTKSNLDALRLSPENQQLNYKDPTIKHLSLVLGRKTKTWYFRNKHRRLKLGIYPYVTLGAAKAKVHELMLHAYLEEGDTFIKAKKDLPTLAAYLAQWLSIAETVKPHERVRDLMSALGDLKHTPLDQLTTETIKRWRMDFIHAKERPRKASTVNRHLSFLKARLNEAVSDGILLSNPLTGLAALKEADHRVRYLDDDERSRFMHILNQRDDFLKPMCLIALYTGLRRGEIYSMKWDHIQWQNNSIYIPASSAKNHTSGTVPINRVLVESLQAWQQCSDGTIAWVFPSPVTQAKRQGPCVAFNNFMSQTGINDFHFHDMRHDFASRLVQRGIDLYQVKELMRHKDIKMTQRYAHLAPKQLHDAVEALL